MIRGFIAVMLAFMIGGWSGKHEARQQYQASIVKIERDHDMAIADMEWKWSQKYENCIYAGDEK